MKMVMNGVLIKNNNKYYFNLKFVCDNGGAQTRTLKKCIILLNSKWNIQ